VRVTIWIPNNVEEIGSDCFHVYKALCEVVFESESKLKEIGNSAFRISENSAIKTIRILNSVEKIGDACFYKCDYLKVIEDERQEDDREQAHGEQKNLMIGG
jgi:hypothetical protein